MQVEETNGVGRRSLVVSLWAGFTLLSVTWLLGAMAATKLRPSNDDYWIGAESLSGPASIWDFWWQNWSGDLLMLSSNYLFVGLPLAIAPWPLTSSVAFVLTSLLIGLAGVTISSRSVRLTSRPVLLSVALMLIIGLGWWVFLWIRDTSGISESTKIVIGLTHWQNLNSGYVIPAALCVVALVWITRPSDRSPTSNTILFLAVGFLIGFSGVVLAATVAIGVAVFVSVMLGFRQWKQDPRIVPLLALALGVLVALTASIASPGSRTRNNSYANYDFWNLLHPETLGKVASQVFTDLEVVFWTPASVFILVFGVAVTGLLSWLGYVEIQQKVGLSALVMFGATLVFIVSNAFGEAYVWGGYGFWHRAIPFFLGYLTLIQMSLLLARYLGQSLLSFNRALISLLAVTLFVIAGAASVSRIDESASQRLSSWDFGGAPVPGVIKDLGDGENWIDVSWQRLAAGRSAPDRTKRP